MIEKVVIISGATGGLGRAITKKCVEDEKAEFEIVTLFRRKDKMDKLLRELQNHSRVNPIEWDFSDNRHESRMVDILMKREVPREVTFIHTAYDINPITLIGNIKDSDLRKNLYTNVVGVASFLNLLVEKCKENGIRLNIVNIDSGAAYHPIKGWSLYSSGKAYINMFLRTLILENENIYAITYEPGVVDTSMQKIIRNTDEKDFEQVYKFQEYYEKKLLNDPNEIAKDIYYRFIRQWTPTEFRTGIKECDM